MESVNISELRANLLSYLKKARDGSEIAVTSHGEVLATIGPPVDRLNAARTRLNQLAETATLHDVVAPIDAPWNALS